MFWFFIQGIKTDLWNTLPPKPAQKICGQIYDEGFGILVVRYSQVTPSSARLPQFRGDLGALLFMTSEVMTYLVHSIDKMFNAKLRSSDNRIIWNIHNKAFLLLQTLSVVGSPVNVLHQVSIEFNKAKSISDFKLSNEEAKTSWLHMTRPGLFGSLKQKKSLSSGKPRGTVDQTRVR